MCLYVFKNLSGKLLTIDFLTYILEDFSYKKVSNNSKKTIVLGNKFGII